MPSGRACGAGLIPAWRAGSMRSAATGYRAESSRKKQRSYRRFGQLAISAALSAFTPIAGRAGSACVDAPPSTLRPRLTADPLSNVV